MSNIVGDKFELFESIGGGSFGEIYLSKNTKSGEEVAAKVEKLRNKTTKSQLKREAKIYRMLCGSVGIPRVRWYGEYTDRNILVMDLLGHSLEDLFNYCGRRFSVKTVLLLAYEMISRIEIVHTQGCLIHRDIKPENFLIGRNRDRHTVYLIDFGLAKHYCNPETGRHIPCKEGNSLTGTARYASLNAHKGLEQSRRDDLFSIGYVLMYFLRGSLPWQGLKTRAQLLEEAGQQGAQHPETTGTRDAPLPAHVPTPMHGPSPVPPLSVTPPPPPLSALGAPSNDPPLLAALGTAPGLPPQPAPAPVATGAVVEGAAAQVAAPASAPTGKRAPKVRRETEEQEKYRLIMEKKQATSVEELCAGFREEFVQYFDHVAALAYADTPDYAHLKGLFRDLFRRLGYTYEAVLYDWEVKAEQQRQQERAERERLLLQQQTQQMLLAGQRYQPTAQQHQQQAGASQQRRGERRPIERPASGAELYKLF